MSCSGLAVTSQRRSAVSWREDLSCNPPYPQRSSPCHASVFARGLEEFAIRCHAERPFPRTLQCEREHPRDVREHLRDDRVLAGMFMERADEHPDKRCVGRIVPAVRYRRCKEATARLGQPGRAARKRGRGTLTTGRSGASRYRRWCTSSRRCSRPRGPSRCSRGPAGARRRLRRDRRPDRPSPRPSPRPRDTGGA